MKFVTRELTIISFVVLLLPIAFAAQNKFARDEASPPENSSEISNDGVTWIFPTSASSSAFNSVDTLNAQWQSSFAKPNLALWCKPQDAPTFKSRSNYNVVQTGSHAVLLDISQIAQTVICHLTLQDTSNLTLTSNSSPFTIAKAPNANPQTWSANSLTAPTASIATPELSPPTATSSSTATSAAPSNDPLVSSIDSTHGLSTAAGVGIGIGVAVLVTLLALGALLFCLHRRQRQNRQKAPEEFASGHGHVKNRKKSSSNMMMKKNTIRVIPGLYETVGNRPIPQELDAFTTSTPLSTTIESEGSEPRH